MTTKLKAVTPHGIFTRKTATPYRYVVVRDCKRSHDTYLRFLDDGDKREGVAGRWIKDFGYAVTWHQNIATATNAAKGEYDWADSTVLGIFPVINDD